MEKIRCLIIGGGPAGYTAAIYASRAALEPVLYEGMEPGGQLTTTTVVENFPGFPDGVDANQLMDGMRAQAKRLGADIRRGVVTAADLSKRPFRLTIDGETELEDVAVVGGGDTACEEATYLANLCRKVYMIVRRDVFRASVAMQERVRNTSNIEVLWNCNTLEVLGDESGVTGVRVQDKDGKVFDVKADGFFLAIGHHPNSDIFKKYVETDENGYIITKGKTSETNVEGVFAAGDVQDPRFRQAITAAASGCRAALEVEKFLLSH